MPLTYGQYLNLDALLSLQQPRSDDPEHDEMLFIIIHQVYELWFKQIIHELEHVQRAMETNNKSDIFQGLKRILTILKTLVSQVDILETLTPVSFSSFRARLENASGFQSVQFRELEFILGKRNAAAVERLRDHSGQCERLVQRLHQPALWDSFLHLLRLNGLDVPLALIQRDVSLPCPTSLELQANLLEIYRKRSTLMQLCERLVDLDEGIQEWRYRHIKMVERTIGNKQGTGGSAGVQYLKNTLFSPLFPDLWAIRSAL